MAPHHSAPLPAPTLPNAAPHHSAPQQAAPHNAAALQAPAPHHSALPDSNAAARAPPPPLADADTLDGHPQFPFPDDVSSFLGSDVDTDMGTASAERWEGKEDTRITRAKARGLKPRKPDEEKSELVGPWAGLTFETTHHSRNLMDWVAAGCAVSYAMVLHLEQYWGLRPLERRSRGIGLLLKAQMPNRIAFFLATTGGPPPLSTKSTRKKRAPDMDAEMPAAPPIVVTTSAVMISDAATFGGAGIWSPAYLGLSPPGNDGGTINSRSSEHEATAYWEKIPTSHWHQGMRNVYGVYPTAVHDHPMRDDVRVVLTLEVFGPEDGPAREEFTANSMSMFSCAGMFGKFVHNGGYPQIAQAAERYNFSTDHMDWSRSASWWSTHGLLVGSDDVRAMESFAMSYRNQATNDLPTNFMFVNYPNDVTCVGSISDSEITPWNCIVHAELRPGLTSRYPRRPAGHSPDHDDLMEGDEAVAPQDRLDWSEGPVGLGPIPAFVATA